MMTQNPMIPLSSEPIKSLLATPNVAIYARKSTESEDRQILSIDSQVRELRQFAERARLKVTRTFIETKSAKSPGRLVFNEIFSLIQKGRIDALVCWKLDRLARNPVDGGAVIWAMEERKLVAIHTPQRSFSNTGNDKFWMQLEFGMAKKYVDDLSDNVKRGIRAKLELGWLPGLPPLGYMNDRNARTIVKDPERFPLVRRMWDLMLSGRYAPPQVLELASSQWGLRTRPFKRLGGKPLVHSAIYKLFTNPFYYGALVHNGEFYRGKHPPMIKKSEFDRVQHLLNVAAHPRAQHHQFAYTGLIKCGECGAAITGEHKFNRQGHEYVYYRCTRHKRGVPCTQRVITLKELERQIVVFLDSITLTARIRNWAIRVVLDLRDDEEKRERALITASQRRTAACKRELMELVSMRLRGMLSDEVYLAKKQELEEERTRLQEVSSNTGAIDNTIEKSVMLLKFAGNVSELFKSGSIEERRSILQYTGLNPLLKDKVLTIQPQKPFFFIQKDFGSAVPPNGRVEPRILCLPQPKLTLKTSSKTIWCGRMDQVCTFYRENPSAPSFKQILSEARKRTRDQLEQFMRRKRARRKLTTGSVAKSSAVTIAE